MVIDWYYTDLVVQPFCAGNLLLSFLAAVVAERRHVQTPRTNSNWSISCFQPHLLHDTHCDELRDEGLKIGGNNGVGILPTKCQCGDTVSRLVRRSDASTAI